LAPAWQTAKGLFEGEVMNKVCIWMFSHLCSFLYWFCRESICGWCSKMCSWKLQWCSQTRWVYAIWSKPF